MADTKISALSEITDIEDTDDYVVARGGATKRITGENLVAAIGSGWTEVVKESDESIASTTTVQNDDELFFTTVSGGQYEIECVLVYGSPAGGGTPDLKAAFAEDSTARGWCHAVYPGSDDSTTHATIEARTGATYTFGTATANRIVKVALTYIGNGGTFRVSWAQGTSGGNATILRAGSRIRYRQIA